MKKTVSVVLALVFLLGIAVSGALADTYDYPDTTQIQPWSGNSPTGAAFTDVEGSTDLFQTFGANLSGTTFTIFTNWNPNKDGSLDAAVTTADLFIDLGADGSWDYAIGLDTGREDNIYSVAGGKYKTSQDIFYNISGIYGGRYDVSDDAHKVPVLATGSIVDTLKVDWTYGTGDLNNQVAIDFSGFAFPSEPVGFLWGTATCANDTFATYVPIPPSVLLMGSGLLGLGLLGWRRRGSEDQAG